MPFRKEAVCAGRWSAGSRRHTSHPRQRGYGAVPEPLQEGWLGSQGSTERSLLPCTSALSSGSPPP